MTLASLPVYDRERISTVGDHAIVLGGSMSGLLATRVLADAFNRVTLVERDTFSEEPGLRRGVPQAKHAHAMLEAGRATLEDFFPGYGERVRAAGGITMDMATEFDMYYDGQALVDSQKPLPMLSASRPLFEQVVREQVRGLDGVTIRSGCQCTDYLRNGSEAVTGVAITADDTEEELIADLVVDATGRTSQTPRWLDRHDYSVPDIDEVKIDLAYSTVVIERPAEKRHAMLVSLSQDCPRGAAILPIENEQWIVTLFGVHGDHPPTDARGFREFAAGLPTNAVVRRLEANAQVSDEIHHYPFPTNRWHHYERLDRFPEGLVVTGDAVASFNPIYGQGMSVATLDALQLHHALADGLENLAERFFDRIAETIQIIWWMTVSADFEFPETTGPKPFGTDLINRYLSRLIRTGYRDKRVTDVFARVHRLERPPTALLRPGILFRVLVPMRLNGHL